MYRFYGGLNEKIIFWYLFFLFFLFVLFLIVIEHLMRIYLFNFFNNL